MRLSDRAGSPRTLVSLLLTRLALIACTAAALVFFGCRTSPRDTSVIGTFRMGENVQAGPLVYQVMEGRWAAEIPGVAKKPAERFLLVRVTIMNSSSRPVTVPAFTLHGPNEQVFQEVTEGVGDAPNWLGMLRTIQPNQKLDGYAIFDVPIGAYKLAASDGADVGVEKYAHIAIPADIS